MRDRLGRITNALVDAVDRRGADWPPSGLDPIAAKNLLEQVRSAHPVAAADASSADRLGRIFGLTDLDLDLLVAAAAVDLDVAWCQLSSALAGLDIPGHLTAGTALELVGRPVDDGFARARLRMAAPLIRHGLLRLSGTGPWPFRQLVVPDRVLAHLLGDDTPEPTFDALTVPVPSVGSELATRLGRGLLAGGALAHLIDAPGTSGLATAVAAFASIGVAGVVVDLSHRPREVPWTTAAVEAARETGLLGTGLVVTGVDSADSAMPELLHVLASAPVPVIVVDRRRWAPDWTPVVPLTLTADALDRAARTTLWHTVVPETVVATEGFGDVVGLAMTAEEIVRTGQAAGLTAAADDTTPDLDAIRQAARRAGGAQLDESAHRIVPQATLADLILPPATRQALDELVSWARHREELLGRARLGGKGTKGSGVVALFAGPPGTGKTLAAEAVAGELGLELYTVELSAIVDKYIGETEKKLERIIREAEALNVVLFFDEADAIFGQRSAVREAKDRYANQEVSYLLQRMERFSGLAVLATNLRGNLDPAFSRRLHFVVSFVDPPAEVRERLWVTHLEPAPSLDPTDPVDAARLAAAVDLAGGGIKNIVMAAAFAAAAQGQPMGMRHLVSAAERELGKLGRRAPAALSAMAP